MANQTGHVTLVGSRAVASEARVSAQAFPLIIQFLRERHFGASHFRRLLVLVGFVSVSLSAHATITAVSIHSPRLSAGTTVNVTSPVHFQGTAESGLTVTGYVVYVDSQNVFRNYSPSLDAWVILAPGGTHSVAVTAWDSSGSSLSTATYNIYVTDVAVPLPPSSSTRLVDIDKTTSAWTVDNNNKVGGQCNDGSIGTYVSTSDPNTANAPNSDGYGQRFQLASKCQYDDSLFYWKYSSALSSRTNFLWDFWFYIPVTTKTSTIQALEFDLFQAVKLSDGVHEFMFGSQCEYPSNHWQLWLPQNGSLAWVNTGLAPCQFSTGTWHHATYFLQRVTSSGYQEIPMSSSSSTDTNSDLRFGTLSVDGNTLYLGELSNSTIPNPAWSPTFGVNHQLDSSVSGVTINEYITEESVTAW
jgi:hypothetical protein